MPFEPPHRPGEPSGALPPPVPGTTVGATAAPPPGSQTGPQLRPQRVVPTLPSLAAWGAIAVLTASLIASKYLLDAVVDFDWPVAFYVAMLAVVAYGPSLWWCQFASRRWATGDLGRDIGLSHRLADLGWGPVVWLCAIGSQLAVAAIVVGFGIPLENNTDALSGVQDDRTYVVSLVITAVIAAPIVEEMVFRGVVMRGLRSRMPMLVVVVLQGLLFGAAHIDPVRGAGNIGLVMVLSGVGIAFGAATAILGRIGPAIVAHALFNGVILLVVLTGVADRLQDSSGREQVGVVDEAHGADAHRDRDPARVGPAVVGGEFVDADQRVGFEHLDVIELGERLVGHHRVG